jgi:hypothetical protein
MILHLLMVPHMCLMGLSSSISPQVSQATDTRSWAGKRHGSGQLYRDQEHH